MDAPSNIKSRGLRFAEQQLKRHGWTEGKGLGKREDGISKAIKVKVKFNTAGVGHNSAEQFTFHWWDHVFNKTASSIAVEPDQDGVKVKKLSEDDSFVSNKKPRKAMLCSNMLYGRFIKSATLTSGGVQPMEEASSDASDSSEDEDSKLDLSSANKVSDKDLVKICGGRTAHKGARHGLTMSAKLSRIKEQERAFMEKYGKKETKLQPSKSASEERLTEEEFNGKDKKMRKKEKNREGNINGKEQDNSEVTKKKKKQKKEDVPNGNNQEHVPSTEEDDVTSKKRSKVPDNIESAQAAEVRSQHKNKLFVEEENCRPTKKRRKTVESQESMMFNGHTEDECSGHEKEEKEYENTEEVAGRSKKKKKKKKNKRTEDHEELVGDEEYAACSEEGRSRKPKNKKWRAEEENAEENDPSTEEEEEGRSRRKKKKLVDKEDEPKDEEDTKATKKKKKSKHKDRRD